jgi:predicted double-glycine peptidase
VATLLSYHYGRPTSEQEVFKAMYANGDKEAIRTQGFSMLDMKTYLQSVGYPSNGYRVPLDKLAAASVPAITLVNANGYMHFVVIKGLKGDEVLVGDPALGAKVVDRKTFEEMWNGIAFVLLGEREVAERFFNSDQDWAVRAKAPLGTALMYEGLSTFTLHIPGPDFF